MRIFVVILFTFNLQIISIFAQNSIITGKIVDTSTGKELSGVVIKVTEAPSIETISENDGSFSLEILAGRNYFLIFSKEGYENFFLKVTVTFRLDKDIGIIKMEPLINVYQDIPTVLFLDSEDDTDFASQNVISLMAGGQDVYTTQASFNFGAVRFNVRGLDSEYNQTYINGVNFNDQIRGRFNYSMLGGLNDATRMKDIAINTAPSSYGFGDVGGITNIDTRAGSYAKGGRITASATNRSYKLRGIGTYSTGLMDNGFAATASIGYRWADEGYFEGTFYNSMSYLFAIEKIFGHNKKHSLSLTTMGSPTQRGQTAASYQEIYDLQNTRYNPNWGWQNGEKRNSRIVTAYDPMAVLSHNWNISQKMQLTTGFGVRFNQYAVTGLNWYNAPDPRPDYYKYLPSWDSLKFSDPRVNYEYRQKRDEIVEFYRRNWEENKVSQINWYELYEANFNSRAVYIVEERHSNLLELTFNSTLKTNVSDWQLFEIGIEAKKSKGMYFKTINDLLGGEYWLDKDQFSERDFPDNPEIAQNDMNNLDRVVKEGEIFGYNYDIFVNNANLWLQNKFYFPKIDFYYAVKLSFTEFQRYGHMKNGRAPDNSYGKGKSHSFVNQALKGGLNYKITGRHFIAVNALYATKAPLPWDAYLSARIKDDAIPELKNERILSADISYLISFPTIKGRLTAFQTNFYDQNEIKSFYHDDYRTFVNYVMTGVNKCHRGIEVGFQINLTQRLRLDAISTIAEYRYKNRPLGYATYENGIKPQVTETIYLKNFFVGGTPQVARSIGFNYNFPNYWYLNINNNFFDHIYIDLTPVRRTERALEFPADNFEEYHDKAKEINKQEKYMAISTIDASIGKSIRFNNGYFLSMNLSINNILNNTKIRQGGLEQGRFDYDGNTTDKFLSKYYYSQGINYFFNAALRF